MTWTTPAPRNLRAALYDGELVRLPPVPASDALVRRARALLEAELGPEPREAVHRLPAPELFARLGRVRKALYLDPESLEEVADLLHQHGLDPAEWAVDPARLRVVHPGGERNPAAAAVYAVHRDTWYGHPSCLVTWWIPLDDLLDEETFELWPAYLRAPVPNDSEAFDYDEWVSRGWSLKIGWQDAGAGLLARYPAFLGDRAALGPGVGFAAKAAESRLFAGAHLHATKPHAGPRTRFSLDFRMAHLADVAEGVGAPSVDDRSRGSAAPDYERLPAR